MSCQSEKKLATYPKFVGDIAFDKNIDEAGFSKCGTHQDYSFQYYYDSNDFEYKGEKLAIIRKLESENIKSTKEINGYVTIRFLVNCEGRTGLFRVQQMSLDYKEKLIDKNLGDDLLKFTKSLKGWIPKEVEGEKVDYYQYLTYKIEHGKVSEILP